MKPTPLLSICIPTYNRANRAASCVKACLELPYEDLEVVCLDNCSTDDTEQKLAQISDERFVYRRNSENIGYPNIVEVLRHASGEYALLLSDEDRINPRFVADALELLKTEKRRPLSGSRLPPTEEKEISATNPHLLTACSSSCAIRICPASASAPKMFRNFMTASPRAALSIRCIRILS